MYSWTHFAKTKKLTFNLIAAAIFSTPLSAMPASPFLSDPDLFRIIRTPDGSELREPIRVLPDGQQLYLIELDQQAAVTELLAQPEQSQLNSIPVPQYLQAINQVQQQQTELASTLQNQQLITDVRASTQLLLNSILVVADPANLEAIRATRGVKSVTPNREVALLRMNSIPLIRADQVWKFTDAGQRNLTGRGIRIGVLDSGIDYTHPDLGGCFGPGCKVADGYDFYDNDPDPKDRNGHGTHVAGIIAGKSNNYKGVAPDATLYAYRVCEYSCYNSDVILALERSADPDKNPLTSDALDIVNLSLGGSGTQDDPMTIATNNAVKAGIVVVVAAGNDGTSYGALGSPANAELAISVAASNKSDQITSYSSRGPADTDQFVKPDLTAPGDSIYSTLPNNDAGFKSGTSMAAPHVAGAAALLKQQQLKRTPSMIKSLLMSQTKDIGASVAEQGSGRLDVLAAAQAELTMAPQSLSFGKVDLTQSLWQNERKLTLFNHGKNNKKLTLTVPTLPEGVTLKVTNGLEVEVAAGAQIELVLELAVNTNLFQPTGKLLLQGLVLQINDGTTPYRLPLAMMYYHKQKLNTAGNTIEKLRIFNHDGELAYDGYAKHDQNIRLPSGTYDFIAEFVENDRLKLVVLEQQKISADGTLQLTPSMAKHRISLSTLKDESGIRIDTESLAGGLEAIELRHKSKPFFYNRIYPPFLNIGSSVRLNGEKALYLSDLSADYQLAFSASWLDKSLGSENLSIFSVVQRHAGIRTPLELHLETAKMAKLNIENPRFTKGSQLYFSYRINYELGNIGYKWLPNSRSIGYDYRIGELLAGQSSRITLYGNGLSLTPHYGVGNYELRRNSTVPYEIDLYSGEFRFTENGQVGKLQYYIAPDAPTGYLWTPQSHRYSNIYNNSYVMSYEPFVFDLIQAVTYSGQTIYVGGRHHNAAGNAITYSETSQGIKSVTPRWRCDFGKETTPSDISISYYSDSYQNNCSHISLTLSAYSSMWYQPNESLVLVNWTNPKSGTFSQISNVQIGSDSGLTREFSTGKGWVRWMAKAADTEAAIYIDGKWQKLTAQRLPYPSDALPHFQADINVGNTPRMLALRLSSTNQAGATYTVIVQNAIASGDSTSVRSMDQDTDGLVDFYDADDDNDGISDIRELSYEMNPAQADLAGDVDKDGLSNEQEISLGTRPNQADTDLDMAPDGWEVQYAFNPLLTADGGQDADNDGLTNAAEYKAGTDPKNADSDGDSLPDGWEVKYDLNPLNSVDTSADPDKDSLTNITEFKVGTNPLKPDTDSDGMPDGWELKYALNPTSAADATLDLDNDGLNNTGEFAAGTDPVMPDSDSDGLPDGWEVRYDLNPLSNTDAHIDLDKDDLTNLAELKAGTHPQKADTDNDDMPDGWETKHGLNPVSAIDAVADPDRDDLPNKAEYIAGTDPAKSDSDNDEIHDGWEVKFGLNPTRAVDALFDSDRDELTNIAEFKAGTNPTKADTDNDTMSDGWEMKFGFNPLNQADAAIDADKDELTNSQEFAAGTDPLKSDSDNDSLPDGWELKFGLNPINMADAAADTDKDDLTSIAEFKAGTDPTKADTDSDSLPDGWEVKYALNPLSAADNGTDPDKDELINSAELKAQTDPTKADTDSDGIPDGWEVKYGLNPLNAADASSDSDNDGKTALQEYQGNTNPTVSDKQVTGGNTGTGNGNTSSNSGSSSGGGSLDLWWLALVLFSIRRWQYRQI